MKKFDKLEIVTIIIGILGIALFVVGLVVDSSHAADVVNGVSFVNPSDDTLDVNEIRSIFTDDLPGVSSAPNGSSFYLNNYFSWKSGNSNLYDDYSRSFLVFSVLSSGDYRFDLFSVGNTISCSITSGFFQFSGSVYRTYCTVTPSGSVVNSGVITASLVYMGGITYYSDTSFAAGVPVSISYYNGNYYNRLIVVEGELFLSLPTDHYTIASSIQVQFCDLSGNPVQLMNLNGVKGLDYSTLVSMEEFKNQFAGVCFSSYTPVLFGQAGDTLVATNTVFWADNEHISDKHDGSSNVDSLDPYDSPIIDQTIINAGLASSASVNCTVGWNAAKTHVYVYGLNDLVPEGLTLDVFVTSNTTISDLLGDQLSAVLSPEFQSIAMSADLIVVIPFWSFANLEDTAFNDFLAANYFRTVPRDLDGEASGKAYFTQRFYQRLNSYAFTSGMVGLSDYLASIDSNLYHGFTSLYYKVDSLNGSINKNLDYLPLIYSKLDDLDLDTGFTPFDDSGIRALLNDIKDLLSSGSEASPVARTFNWVSYLANQISGFWADGIISGLPSAFQSLEVINSVTDPLQVDWYALPTPTPFVIPSGTSDIPLIGGSSS